MNTQRTTPPPENDALPATFGRLEESLRDASPAGVADSVGNPAESMESTSESDHHGSKKAVTFAIIGNGIITVSKFFAAVVTGSASMMNETVHSLMDTVNQLFLFFGLSQSARPADSTHAFGHGQKKYLWNLWSAIGLFSIGAGLGLSHAWHSWHEMGSVEPVTSVTFGSFSFHPAWISFVVLGFALIVEVLVLWVAGTEFVKRMRDDGESSVVRYILKSDDPTLTAVVLEDSVAVLGLLLAATGIGLSLWLNDPVWDILFSVLIAFVLGAVAVLLGAINMKYLTAVRDHDAETIFEKIVTDHPQIERYHDLRSVIVDNNHTVLVAEVELREESLLPGLSERISAYADELRRSAQAVQGENSTSSDFLSRAAIETTLQRTEEIIDEIEIAVRKRCQRVSHITIEVQGIAAEPDSPLISSN